MAEILKLHRVRRNDSLFSLRPRNANATNMVMALENERRRSILNPKDVKEGGTPIFGLDVGLFDTVSQTHTHIILARLGRKGCELVAPSTFRFISGSHCSFKLDLKTDIVTLWDNTGKGNTHIVKEEGEDAEPFYPMLCNTIVIGPNMNRRLSLGTSNVQSLEFFLDWNPGQKKLLDSWRRGDYTIDVTMMTDWNHTTLELPTSVAPTEKSSRIATRRVTRIHTSNMKDSGFSGSRCHRLRVVAQSQHALVTRAVYVDDGQVVAIKTLTPSGGNSDEDLWRSDGKREAENLSRVSGHANIVELLHHEEVDGEKIELYMPFKAGNLADLVESYQVRRCMGIDFNRVVWNMSQQMLLAIEFLDQQQLVHQDIKPTNILYDEPSGGEHVFQLADFGTSNHVTSRKRIGGTLLFAAPELLDSKIEKIGDRGKSKADIWSLFVTILWAKNERDFRDRYKDRVDLQSDLTVLWNEIEELGSTSDDEDVRRLEWMGKRKPDWRLTATQALANSRTSRVN